MNQGIFSFPGEAGAPSMGLHPVSIMPAQGIAPGIRFGNDRARRMRRVPRICAPPQAYLDRDGGSAQTGWTIPYIVPAGMPPDGDLVFLMAWEENVGSPNALTFGGVSIFSPAIAAANTPGALATPVVGAYGVRRGNFAPGRADLVLGGVTDMRSIYCCMFPVQGVDPSTWTETTAQVVTAANADEISASVDVAGPALVLGIAGAQGNDMNPVYIPNGADYVVRGVAPLSSSTGTELTIVAWSRLVHSRQTLTELVRWMGAGSIAGGGGGDGRGICLVVLQGAP